MGFSRSCLQSGHSMRAAESRHQVCDPPPPHLIGQLTHEPNPDTSRHGAFLQMSSEATAMS